MGTELPVDIIYDILSRIPVKSLDRFRCACKTWCNYIDDPNLAIIHLKRAPEEPLPIMLNRSIPPDPKLPHTVTFSSIISKSNECTEMQKKSVFQFECNEPLCNSHIIRGSCNGLLFVSNRINKSQTTFSVIHPLRKERYELPPIFSMSSCGMYICGLGFDDSTNTFKMCVWDGDHKAIRIMVHVLGTTDSWREISQVPYYYMSSKSVFAHGYLHWLGCLRHYPLFDRQKVIRFDVSKEEFSSIDPPRKTKDDWDGINLVDFNGEVGFVYKRRSSMYSMEVWVLKQNQWVVHTRFDLKPPLYCNLKSVSEIEIVGLWNKSGDILVSADGRTRLFVYSRKSQDFHEIKVDGWEDGCRASVHMYQSSLFSIHCMKK